MVRIANESDPGTWNAEDFSAIVGDLATIEGGGEVRDLCDFDALRVQYTWEQAQELGGAREADKALNKDHYARAVAAGVVLPADAEAELANNPKANLNNVEELVVDKRASQVDELVEKYRYEE